MVETKDKSIKIIIWYYLTQSNQSYISSQYLNSSNLTFKHAIENHSLHFWWILLYDDIIGCGFFKLGTRKWEYFCEKEVFWHLFYLTTNWRIFSQLCIVYWGRSFGQRFIKLYAGGHLITEKVLTYFMDGPFLYCQNCKETTVLWLL